MSITTVMAQRTGDVTIYSNTGKKFYVVLNGVRQNQIAETNVKITGLADSWYSCRIMAEDKSFNIEKNLGVKKDSVITYRVIEKKGKYKLRYYSESSLGTAPVVQDQMSVVYHATDLPETNVQTQVTNNTGQVNQQNGSVTTTTTTSTSTTTSGNGESGSVSFGINVDENGVSTSGQTGSESINIDINVNENGMGTNMNIEGNGGTYEETTTTTSSTTTTINGQTTHSEQTTITTNTNGNQTTYYEETTTTGQEGNLYMDQDVTMTMSTGGCLTTEEDMIALKQSINNADFSDDKMRVANQAAKSKCMTVAQIKEIALLFDFDDNRMQFVKNAHLNCMNQADYYQLMDLFTFSTDKEELERFLNER